MRRIHRLLLPALATILVAACVSTTPAPAKPVQPMAAPTRGGPSADHLAVARRFLHGFGAGDIAMAGLKKELESQAKEQPGMAELVRRAFVDVKAEDFEILAANVYARHMSKEHLGDLAKFIESPTGNRFFSIAIKGVMEGKKPNTEEAMRQFSADELTELIQFIQGPAFTAMQQNLPVINQEMADEGSKLGERLLKEYLNKK